MHEAVDCFFFYRSLELVQVGDTRWVSHFRAASTLVTVLKTCMHALFAMSESQESSSAKQQYRCAMT